MKKKKLSVEYKIIAIMVVILFVITYLLYSVYPINTTTTTNTTVNTTTNNPVIYNCTAPIIQGDYYYCNIDNFTEVNQTG